MPRKKDDDAAGRDPIIGVRVPPDLRRKVEKWGKEREPALTMSAAVRELLQVALASGAVTARGEE